MKITRTYNVDKCSNCPYSQTTMDGSICTELEKKYGPYEGFIYPEGYETIHPKCPFLKKGTQ